MNVKETTDTDVLRWLLGKMTCHRGSQLRKKGWWSLPPDTLVNEAESPLEACLSQMAQESQKPPRRRL